jgi:arsenate reductase
MNILFLCTGNSCRSIMAEAVFNHLAPSGWKAMSAGSTPAGFVHPLALLLLSSEGIPTEGLSSKSWTGLPTVPDVVVSVCDNAARESCPVYLGKALKLHWGVRDPAEAKGSDGQVEAVFREVYHILRFRIETFLSLVQAGMDGFPDRLTPLEKERLERIGILSPDGKENG